MPGGNAVSAVLPRKPDHDRGRCRAGGCCRARFAKSVDARDRRIGDWTFRDWDCLWGGMVLVRSGEDCGVGFLLRMVVVCVGGGPDGGVRGRGCGVEYSR